MGRLIAELQPHARRARIELRALAVGAASAEYAAGRTRPRPTAPRSPPPGAPPPLARVCGAAGAAVPVQLDGAQPFDPEADPLTFAWSEAGVALATGPCPVITLAPGEHGIALVACDGTRSSAADDPVTTLRRRPAPEVRVGQPAHAA